MTGNEISIECKRVKFYSPYDESAFFEWIEKIKCIKKVKGKKDSIFLFFNSNNIQDEELYNLFGLFRRYKINKNELEAFLNEENKDYFHEYQEGYSINVYPVGD